MLNGRRLADDAARVNAQRELAFVFDQERFNEPAG
jgi:hypothetical protein